MPIKPRRQPENTHLPYSPTQPTEAQPKTPVLGQFGRWFHHRGLGHLLVGVWAISGAIATGMDWSLVQSMERQAQTLFFQLRGSVAPPKDIVILAIDEESLAQGQFYQADPQKLAYLEPLKTWPWKREVYGTVINKLMAAGAKSVALDIVLDRPSSYGQVDDETLRQALQTYAGRITLAASYEDVQTRQGGLTQLIQPNSVFQTNPMSVGSINYPMERNGRVHRLASQFPRLLAQSYPNQAKEFYEFVATVPSFDQATLKAARLNYPEPKGDNIFFYGPAGTFEIIPFWYVLEPNNWNGFLENGKYFKDKIVLIGGTASLFQDYHPTPFSESWLYPEPMSGVEIHANAIATLLQGRSIAEAIPNPTQRGLFVFIGIVGAGFLSTQLKKGPVGIAIAVGVAIAWGGVSYLCFVYGRLIVPTAIPVFVIALSGFSYGTIGAIKDHLTKRNLRRTLKHYASAPIVQEIISQQNELQDLLQEREQETLGQTLGGRYKIIALLSSGGFGETYIAEDTQRPGNPRCVVKQLKPVSNNPQRWLLAERLFIKEAEILERLGKHDQIPQLLAYFREKEEFYLIEELIVGHPLSQEMPVVLPLEEVRVIRILRDLLPLLKFVHSQGVIHRDIKPENIIRRKSDDKLVLIDFGAVKEIRTQLAEDDEQTHFTVGIGTKGYMPSEQSVGSPRYNSDLYAVGMIAVQALTAIHPSRLQEDPETGEIIWENRAKVSPQLAAIINKMIRSNFRDRYQSATEILEALQPLITTLPADRVTSLTGVDEAAKGTPSLQDTPNATVSWPESFTPSETEGVTIPWSDSSISPEVEGVTMPWSDSTAAISQTLSTESIPHKEVKPEGLEFQD